MIYPANVTTELCERAADLLQAWSESSKYNFSVEITPNGASMLVLSGALFVTCLLERNARDFGMKHLVQLTTVASIVSTGYLIAYDTGLRVIRDTATCLETGLNCPKP